MKQKLGKVGKFLKVLREKRLTTIAGAWVFFFLLAIVPIAFLLLTAFSFFGVDISGEVISRLPNEFSEVGGLIFQTASNVSKGFTIFFAVTVVLSCYSLLNQMSKDGYSIYNARFTRKKGLKRKVLSAIALVVLFSIFLFSALAVAFGGEILKHLSFQGKSNVFATILFFLVAIIVSYVIIIVLNKFLSPDRVRVSGVAIGSLISLFIIVIGTIGFIIYLRFFNSYNAFYGSLATVIVFLLWCYILMLGLLLGVIVNMLINKKGAKNVTNKKLNKELQ